MTRRIIDVLMTAALMLQMSMQITEQAAHEYIGITFVALFLIHNYLNRRWYGALFRGKYNLLRAFSTVVNISLLIAFIMTAFSGIIMSENFPALNIESLSFVLMGLHLGLHWGMIAGRIKSLWPAILAIIISGYGLYAFINQDIFSYIILRNQFAFIDYEKNFALVILENISMLSFWVLIGYQTSKILTRKFLTPCLIIDFRHVKFFRNNNRLNKFYNNRHSSPGNHKM